MIRTKLYFLIAVFSLSLTTQARRDPILEKCKNMINSGNWGNRNLADFCHHQYDLPSPFTIKCLKRELTNYQGLDKNIVRECHFHFRDDKKNIYRNFEDYSYEVDMPAELLLPFNIIRRAYTVVL